MVTELRVGLANTFTPVETTHTDWRHGKETVCDFVGPPECQIKVVQICEPLVFFHRCDQIWPDAPCYV